MSNHFQQLQAAGTPFVMFRSIGWSSLLILLSSLLVGALPLQAADPEVEGLITIESDQQSADTSTGVITAFGNVRLVHANRGVVATSRQAQYFTKEERIVLSGDVDVVQNDGNFLRAGQVTYLLDEERALALPTIGGQVFSQWSLGTESSRPSPKVP